MHLNIVFLIPKVNATDRITDSCPISMANFLFKIITKILVDKLMVITSRIISLSQNDFIKGRSVKDCICITFEANVLSKKVNDGNIAIKIDIIKAFDTIN